MHYVNFECVFQVFKLLFSDHPVNWSLRRDPINLCKRLEVWTTCWTKSNSKNWQFQVTKCLNILKALFWEGRVFTRSFDYAFSTRFLLTHNWVSMKETISIFWQNRWSSLLQTGLLNNVGYEILISSPYQVVSVLCCSKIANLYLCTFLYFVKMFRIEIIKVVSG